MKYGRRGVPATEEDKARHLKGIRRRTILLKVLLSIPLILFWSTILASLERTPLTGRCISFLVDNNHEHVAHNLNRYPDGA
jgi:hypothetical protein